MKNNKQSKTKFTAHKSSMLSAVCKGIAAVVACTVLTLTSFSAVFADSGQTSDTVAQTETQSQSVSEDGETSKEKVDRLLQISVNLGIKEKRTQQYAESLKENGCREENVECCAGVLYALNSKEGTIGFEYDKFDRQENTTLSKFLSEDEVYEFGRTGKIPEDADFKVIYFKDEDDNDTKPAIFYVFSSDINALEVSEIDEYIYEWRKMGAKSFLEAMVANGVSVILHAQASSKVYEVYVYGSNIIFCNNSKDAPSRGGLRRAMGVEMFGVAGESFGSTLGWRKVAVLKSRLALDCCKYMKINFGGDDLLNSYIEFYEKENKEYRDKHGYTDDVVFEELVDYVKATGIFVPFVDATWEEIDTLINDNLWLIMQPGEANDEVLDMKERLQELGYFKSGAALSNIYNETCVERVKLFQQVNGLAETGVVDEQTLTLLYSDTAIANQN